MLQTINDDFDLQKIADSGQCFRWQPIENDGYRIIHGDSCLCIWKTEKYSDPEENLCIYKMDCTKEEYDSIWSVYLDMGEDYRSIREKIDVNSDPFLYLPSIIP